MGHEDLGVAPASQPPLSHPCGAEPVPVSGKAGIANAVGFGGRTFEAKGKRLFVAPLRRVKADGSAGVSLGFPFADMSDLISDDDAKELAEYLSCPIRASAPELLEALAFLIEGLPEQPNALGMYSLGAVSEAAINEARTAIANAKGLAR